MSKPVRVMRLSADESEITASILEIKAPYALKKVQFWRDTKQLMPTTDANWISVDDNPMRYLGLKAVRFTRRGKPMNGEPELVFNPLQIGLQLSADDLVKLGKLSRGVERRYQKMHCLHKDVTQEMSYLLYADAFQCKEIWIQNTNALMDKVRVRVDDLRGYPVLTELLSTVDKAQAA
ncbi:hypothetical protein A6E01_20560 (plasmid) [Vibrio breoganii]|uniref:Uncharacterized protein n=1 Tax=Vibrio breoganii TaxID=553239 RepID=A0AAN0XZL1_9VIBR|nr:hypothetical protein [Vibrio breoganii]ANO35606.1 hypothetical protein A6E01_20560 [Vibrio breoganii]PML10956.1 hypothetical protein BCT84_03585 [Vibrio breoganii]